MNPTNHENIDLLLSNIGDTIRKKNHDYNNAFAEAFAEIGPMYAVGKIFEKYKRIKTLSQTDAAVTNEGLRDALADCIGYCALYIDQLDQAEADNISHNTLLKELGDYNVKVGICFGIFRIVELSDEFVIVTEQDVVAIVSKDALPDEMAFSVKSAEDRESIAKCLDYIFDKIKPEIRPIIRFV